MKHLFTKAYSWFKTYERVLMPATMVLGFVVDALTFRTIQLRSALILLLIHGLVVLGAIAFINVCSGKQAKGKFMQVVTFLMPFLLQLSLGALLSAAMIFYTFGGAFSATWPLLAVLALVMLSNERFASAYRRPLVQFPVLYFALFLVLSVGLPFLLRSIHPIWFFASGLLSFLFVLFFIRFLEGRVERIAEQKPIYVASMLGIFALMAGLYLGNVIPPVPLSLYESGVYHSVQRTAGGYVLEQEAQSLLKKLSPRESIHIVSGGPVYVFTSIVAPGELKTKIVHHWQRKNEATGEWVSVQEVAYPIVGGREQGYRGFSFRRWMKPGTWRVQMETEHGQILGRKVFEIVHVEDQPAVLSRTK